MIVVFLLCAVAGMPASGQILDVCGSCHPDAKCEDKLDGSGKVCNCKYGFVGNGRTFCQDKDECKIGAIKICGQHTKCHNTYGSYSCTCLSGYNPSNNMKIFTPNDGTHCQDIDECRTTRPCGDGGLCRNLEGSFECSCQVGYQVDGGTVPFRPYRDKPSCKVVDCGQPASVEGTVLLLVKGTTYGSVATWACDEGFLWGSGHKTSVCGADGLWSGSTMVCEEVDCGSPPARPHSHILWNRSSSVGSEVVYQCNSGYLNVGKGNVSICTAVGQWEEPPVLCQEILCGDPPIVPHTGQVRNGSSTPGSTVTYYCKIGFYHSEGNNVSLCTINGSWEKPNISCEGMPASGHILDVCGSCHPDAKCEDKLDGSGKVCNCKYGFVGNGRTFCQDKDECKIGAIKICGQHTKCHNTYGSYNCTCLSGYSPSNNMKVFTPNDGTHCQDIDECRTTRPCGDGGLCRNLEGSFECSCQVGYQVDGGTVPFRPYRDKPSCKVVDCGQPASVKDTVLLLVKETTYGSVATWACDEGFLWGSGHNTSVCGADGLWSGSTMVCEEVDCGSPPARPHSHILWNRSSSVGSEVVYQCNSGYLNVGKGNVSICTAVGQWEEPPVLCQETLCGSPPVRESTEHMWNGSTAPGSTVLYFCKTGFLNRGGHNISVCKENGQWTPPTLICQEIDCQEPVHKPHSKTLWDGTSHIGSVVSYQCDEGFHSRSLNNNSVCGESGLWEDIDLWCEETSCGPPLIHPHTNLLWDRTSRPGSVVLYECTDGFYPESGNKISVCSLSGEWGEMSIKCQAKCGPVPFLANSEVVWHNRSVVIHRCVDGYHSWRGSNVSVCGSSGTWQAATLRCIEIKPAVSHVHFLNGKCVHWKAEKYEEDSEAYKVTYTGTRDYQRSFCDKSKQIVRSKADQVKVCIHLLPATNYSISVTALSARFTASITTNTSLTEPPVPIVYYREFETPVPTLRLNRLANTLDPISLYQVVVLLEDIMVFDCSSPGSADPLSKNKSSSKYITAQILIRQVGTQMNFTVGDGLYYGGFYNAPLEKGRTYYIILRAVSQWNTALKSSCVLWAKVRGTSYVLMVSSLSAAAAVGLVAFAILGGCCCLWLFKKT